MRYHCTIHLLGRLKSKTLNTPNAGEVVEQQEFSSIVLEMQNGTATLKYSLLFTELNILLPYDSAITFLSICSNELKICLLGIMHTNNYSNFIHNWPHSEATKMSSNRWMDK